MINTSALALLACDRRLPESIRIALMIRSSVSNTISSSCIFRPDARVAAACILHRAFRSISSSSSENENENQCSSSSLFPHELLQCPDLAKNLAHPTAVANSTIGIDGLVHGMSQGSSVKEATTSSSSSTTTVPKKFYYEVVLPQTHRYTQIRAGWGTTAFGRQGIGQQVGSSTSSIAYNLKSLVHALGGDAEYHPPRHTYPGDVIGCLMDTTTQSVTWSLNGVELTPMSYAAIDTSSSTSTNNNNNNKKKNEKEEKKNDDDDDSESDEDQEHHDHQEFLVPYVSGSTSSSDPLEVRETDCLYTPIDQGYTDYSNVLLSWKCYKEKVMNSSSSSSIKRISYDTYLALNSLVSSFIIHDDDITMKQLLSTSSSTTRKLEDRFSTAAKEFSVLKTIWGKEIEDKTLLKTVQPYLRQLHALSDLSSLCGNLMISSGGGNNNNSAAIIRQQQQQSRSANNNDNDDDEENNDMIPQQSSPPRSGSFAGTTDQQQQQQVSGKNNNYYNHWMRQMRYLTLPTHRLRNFERLAASHQRRGLTVGPDHQPPKAVIDMNIVDDYYKNVANNNNNNNNNNTDDDVRTTLSKNSVLEQLMHQVTSVIGSRCFLTPVPYSIQWKDCIAEDKGGLLRATYSAISDEIMGRRLLNSGKEEEENIDDENEKDDLNSNNNNTSTSSATATTEKLPASRPSRETQQDEEEEDADDDRATAAIFADEEDEQNQNGSNDDDDETKKEKENKQEEDKSKKSLTSSPTKTKEQKKDYPPFCRLFIPNSHSNVFCVVPAPLPSSSSSSQQQHQQTPPPQEEKDLAVYRFLGSLLGNITLTGTGLLSVSFPRMFWMYLLDEKEITVDHYFYDVCDSVKSTFHDDDSLLDDETFCEVFPEAAKKLGIGKYLDESLVEQQEQQATTTTTVPVSSSSPVPQQQQQQQQQQYGGGGMMMMRTSSSQNFFVSSPITALQQQPDNITASSSPITAAGTGGLFPRISSSAAIHHVDPSTTAALHDDQQQQQQQQQLLLARTVEIKRRRRAAEDSLIHMFDRQFQSIKDGFLSIVPREISGELTWFDLERRCCGTPAANIKKEDTIKWFDTSSLNNTNNSLSASASSSSYNNNNNNNNKNDNDQTNLSTKNLSRYFQEALLRLTSSQRAQLLVFCTGQRNLPLPEKIAVTSGMDRDRFPTAHTCSPISLVLQPYQSSEELLEKLLAAISFYNDFSFV